MSWNVEVDKVVFLRKESTDEHGQPLRQAWDALFFIKP